MKESNCRIPLEQRRVSGRSLKKIPGVGRSGREAQGRFAGRESQLASGAWALKQRGQFQVESFIVPLKLGRRGIRQLYLNLVSPGLT